MERAGRIATSILLILAGMALTVFYYLLFAISDCAAGCVEAGERAIPVAFIGIGIGLVVGGIALFRVPARAATGWAISSAGLVAAIGCVLLFAEGSRGAAIWVMTGALAAIFIGGMMRRGAGRARAA